MAIAHQFDYVKPHTIGEAVKVLARFGPRAQVLAGGTDLISLIADNTVAPDMLVDIKGIAGLGDIVFKDGVLTIGALATFTDLRESAVVAKTFPVIREMTASVASAGVRNRATMVGNICSAVPCCDSAPILLVYGAAVLVTGRRSKRVVPLSEWFVGPRKTVLKAGEIVTGIAVPLPRKKHAACFLKLGRYAGEDLAQASVTVLALAGNAYRVAYGSVAPRPIRGEKVEALLAGRPLTDELIGEAVRLAKEEIKPITDIRATKEYRAHMIGVMLECALRAAVARFRGSVMEAFSTEIRKHGSTGTQSESQ